MLRKVMEVEVKMAKEKKKAEKRKKIKKEDFNWVGGFQSGAARADGV